MKCEEIRDLILDVAAGAGEASPAMNEHLLGCDACADKFADMQKTMALLDEWRAPEPSPYFDTRLMARVREERAKPQRSPWLSWFRAPALAGALALVQLQSRRRARLGACRKRKPTVAATCSRSLLSLNSDSQGGCGEKSAYLTETLTAAELLAGVRSWVWAEVVILLAWTLPEAPMALR